MKKLISTLLLTATLLVSGLAMYTPSVEVAATGVNPIDCDVPGFWIDSASPNKECKVCPVDLYCPIIVENGKLRSPQLPGKSGQTYSEVKQCPSGTTTKGFTANPYTGVQITADKADNSFKLGEAAYLASQCQRPDFKCVEPTPIFAIKDGVAGCIRIDSCPADRPNLVTNNGKSNCYPACNSNEQFVSFNGDFKCVKPCPAGQTTTVVNGNLSCVVPPADICEANTYSTTGKKPCTPCPANTNSPAGATVCTPKPCDISGQIRNASGTCACPAGQYVAPNTNVCVPTPATPCPANFYGPSQPTCIACPAGFTSPADSKEFKNCVANPCPYSGESRYADGKCYCPEGSVRVTDTKTISCGQPCPANQDTITTEVARSDDQRKISVIQCKDKVITPVTPTNNEGGGDIWTWVLGGAAVLGGLCLFGVICNQGGGSSTPTPAPTSPTVNGPAQRGKRYAYRAKTVTTAGEASASDSCLSQSNESVVAQYFNDIVSIQGGTHGPNNHGSGSELFTNGGRDFLYGEDKGGAMFWYVIENGVAKIATLNDNKSKGAVGYTDSAALTCAFKKALGLKDSDTLTQALINRLDGAHGARRTFGECFNRESLKRLVLASAQSSSQSGASTTSTVYEVYETTSGEVVVSDIQSESEAQATVNQYNSQSGSAQSGTTSSQGGERYVGKMNVTYKGTKYPYAIIRVANGKQYFTAGYQDKESAVRELRRLQGTVQSNSGSCNAGTGDNYGVDPSKRKKAQPVKKADNGESPFGDTAFDFSNSNDFTTASDFGNPTTDFGGNTADTGYQNASGFGSGDLFGLLSIGSVKASAQEFDGGFDVGYVQTYDQVAFGDTGSGDDITDEGEFDVAGLPGETCDENANTGDYGSDEYAFLNNSSDTFGDSSDFGTAVASGNLDINSGLLFNNDFSSDFAFSNEGGFTGDFAFNNDGNSLNDVSLFGDQFDFGTPVASNFGDFNSGLLFNNSFGDETAFGNSNGYTPSFDTASNNGFGDFGNNNQAQETFGSSDFQQAATTPSDSNNSFGGDFIG